ncbi:MAG: recombinase [Cyanobacteriota bacterium]|nr:recombinase [Cyanobacteriota bacterium]
MPDDTDHDSDDEEQQCRDIRRDNVTLLGEFSIWLARNGLSDATVGSHRFNLDFYLNHFLLYGDTLRATDGVCYVSEFLGDWFLRKATWSTKASVKANAASLKKFYTFMAEKGMITAEELAALKQEIKEQMPQWLDTLERYDNVDLDFDDI